MRKRKFIAIAVILGVGVLGYAAGRARAGGIPSPNALNYAGTLEDANGNPQAGKTVTVSLYTKASGSTSKCGSGMSVTDAKGRFELPLSDKCTDVVNIEPDVYVQINVDGTDLPFRTRLNAVPYAVAALRTTISRNGHQYSDGSTFCTALPATAGSITSGHTTGYAALKSLCETSCGPGAHVCSADDTLRSLAVGLLPQAQTWYATGQVGFDGTVSFDDCGQFTSAATTSHGLTVDAQGKIATASCDTELAVACCD